ncbi:hypothetical protein GGX14DRAFT_394050 [Mycena pura]|uniref:Uncharacterized protein n=1 Tax=Mycena pura TaxID=153505 RepID=A0AAD6VG15_9AGAR|nr:hypothetical protein GGX14DRAFT_394050 [Mycena pura]
MWPGCRRVTISEAHDRDHVRNGAGTGRNDTMDRGGAFSSQKAMHGFMALEGECWRYSIRADEAWYPTNTILLLLLSSYRARAIISTFQTSEAWSSEVRAEREWRADGKRRVSWPLKHLCRNPGVIPVLVRAKLCQNECMYPTKRLSPPAPKDAKRWAEYTLAIDGKPRKWGFGMNECSATQKKPTVTGMLREDDDCDFGIAAI